MRTAAWMLGLLLAGCVARVPEVRLAEPRPVAVLYVVDGARGAGVSGAPEELRRAVEAALARRNLQPREVPLDEVAASLARVRETGRRLQELQKRGGDVPLVLLVELEAEFFSHLQGRYRWQVRARLTAGRPGTEPSTDALDFPAYVNFDHEQVPAVLSTAAPTVADRAGALLDQVLSGEG